MNWKNAAAASWKSFKDFMLLIWSLYDCEPTPEQKERARIRCEEYEMNERCSRIMAENGSNDFVALIVTGLVCAFVLIGGAWIYSDYIKPNASSIKSHIPVKVTVEYRTQAQEDSVKVEAYLRYFASQQR